MIKKTEKNEPFKVQLQKIKQLIKYSPGEKVLSRLKDLIAPKVPNFQFYKLILPYVKFHNHPSKSNNPKLSWSFAQNFFCLNIALFKIKRDTPILNMSKEIEILTISKHKHRKKKDI